jgi:hypothetical protein
MSVRNIATFTKQTLRPAPHPFLKKCFKLESRVTIEKIPAPTPTI